MKDRIAFTRLRLSFTDTPSIGSALDICYFF
jgi:hypothetical protein